MAGGRRCREGRGLVTSAVPDILGPGLRLIFCGINPGFRSADAGAHFANPRNDFWRLLAAAGFTPRLLDPSEQWSLLDLGYGLTNAAPRTTRGSGDLRRADFAGSAERLEQIAAELCPEGIAFVGKAAYEGAFRERPAAGPPGPAARRHLAVRPALDVAGERRRALRGAPAVVHGAPRPPG